MEKTQTYYVRRRGRAEGPWTVSKLKSEVALRKLGRHHEVSVDGTTWQRAGELTELFAVETKRKTLGKAPGVQADREAEATAENTVEAEAVWHYSVEEGQQVGPLTVAQIVEAIQTGRCPLDALAWKEGYGDWLPVEDVPEIITVLETIQQGGGSDTAATRMIETMPAEARSGKARVAFGIGLASMVLSCVPFLGLAGVVAIVVGGLAVREVRHQGAPPKERNLALAGIATGAVGIIVGFMTLIGLGVYLLS